MKVVELFAGIGGFKIGIEKVFPDAEFVFVSEWDKFAKQSYEAIHGIEPVGDITQVDEKDVPDHDLLVGGFPCQAFSVAGNRKGFEDTRGTLFFDMVRIAKEKQPRIILAENVKGLVGHDKGRTLDIMVETLNEIGYTVDFQVLNSKFYGVPQNRERIFIIGVRNDLVEHEDWETKGTTVVPKGKRRIQGYGKVRSFNFDWPQSDDVTSKLRDILENDVDETFYLDNDKTAALIAKLDDVKVGSVDSHPFSKRMEHKGFKTDDVSPCLIATDYKAPKCTLEHMELDGEPGLPIRDATSKGYAIASEGDAVNFKFPTSKTRRGRVGKEIANTLEVTDINQGVVEVNHIPVSNVYGGFGESMRIHDDGVSNTVRTASGGGNIPYVMSDTGVSVVGNISDSGYNSMDVHADDGLSPTLLARDFKGPKKVMVSKKCGRPNRYRIRKLTPKECWRLQGFTDDQHDRVEQSGVSNSQRYKQAGNAVTTNVIEAIVDKLKQTSFMIGGKRNERW